MAPPVSVLLPVRDAASTIDAALDSIRAQTFERFELIVVDDGSTDGTRERVEAHLALDGRLRLVGRQAGAATGDLVAALERGRGLARGDHLLRMDADDLAHPQRLELSYAALSADPSLGGVGCLVRSFPEVSLTAGRMRYDAWLNGLRTHEAMARERFVESPLAHPSLLLRAEALDSVGGYRSFEGPEDYDLWLRMFAAGWRFSKVPRVLHFWRDRPERLSRVDSRYSPAGFARARARALAVELDGRSAVIAGAGTAGRRLARELIAVGATVVAFLDTDERKVGRAPHGIPVVGPREGLASREGALVITCVNAWGARAAARAWLQDSGLVEGVDFVLAA